MSLTVDDSLGLNRTTLQSMPVAYDQGDIAELVGRAKHAAVSMVGSRHSQGGHTLADEGVAILTEPMNRVSVNYDAFGTPQSVTAEAGATWNILHAVLAPLGYSLRVQQSSPHFTVGGSISVNCHGRDPSQGPLSTCILRMEVLVPGKPQLTVLPGDDLFKAVVGGYGSAGIILTATLLIVPNLSMHQQAKEISLAEYATKLLDRQERKQWPALHYGWLNFSNGPNALFSTVLSVDCVAVAHKGPIQEISLKEDGWIGIELMRWLWEQHAQKPDARALTWAAVSGWFRSQNNDNEGKGKENTRNGWLRQSVAFTAHRSDDKADLLQEYFVPLEKFAEFVGALKKILIKGQVNLLSSTVRVVQPDCDQDGNVLTHLSYAPKKAMACVALDFECKLQRAKTGALEPIPETTMWIVEAIEAAIGLGGSYYLPYYGFATKGQFTKAYPEWQAQQSAGSPQLSNRFAKALLSSLDSPDRQR